MIDTIAAAFHNSNKSKNNKRRGLSMGRNLSSSLKGLVKWTKTFYRQIAVALLISVAVLIVYGSDLSIILNDALNNDYYNYVLLLPFLFAFLIYVKKDAIKATLSNNPSSSKFPGFVSSISGLILCLIAFLLYWYGTFTFYPTDYHIISLPIFLAGTILFLSNYQTLRVLILPILFLLFLVIPPTVYFDTAAGALANFNTQISCSLLKALNLPVALSSAYGSPTILLTTAAGKPASFSVDVACSGIYSLVAYLMFAAFLAFIFRTTIFKKLVIFLFGLVVFTLLNPLRIITIVVSGYVAGVTAAGIVHSFSGIVLIFAGMIITLLFSDRLLKVPLTINPKMQPSCSKCQNKTNIKNGFCRYCGKFFNNRITAVSKITIVKLLTLILLCSVAVLTVQAPSFVTAQSTLALDTSSSQQNSTSILPQIQGYNATFLYQDTAYEQASGQIASLMYAYFPLNVSVPFFYVDIGVANTMDKLHNWEVCLISYEIAQDEAPLVTVLDIRDIELLQNPPLTAEFLSFINPDQNNYTQITLYWYEAAPFKIGATVEQEDVRVSLIILTQNSTAYSELEDYLAKVALPIANAWEPLKNESIMSLGIPVEQILLGISIAFLIILTVTQYMAQSKKYRNNRKIFNLYATKKEKIVVDTIEKLKKEKKNLLTTDIIEALQKRVGKPVNSKLVLKILKTLETSGFIRQTIIIDEDTPMQRWRT